MSVEKFFWIYRDEQSRMRGDAPRFEPPIHHCPDCGKDWLCSDRYTQDRCSPQSVFPDMNNWACSLCIGKDAYDDADRAAWWNAHGVEKAEEA